MQMSSHFLHMYEGQYIHDHEINFKVSSRITSDVIFMDSSWFGYNVNKYVILLLSLFQCVFYLANNSSSFPFFMCDYYTYLSILITWKTPKTCVLRQLCPA